LDKKNDHQSICLSCPQYPENENKDRIIVVENSDVLRESGNVGVYAVVDGVPSYTDVEKLDF
jgi:hypothetical protein